MFCEINRETRAGGVFAISEVAMYIHILLIYIYTYTAYTSGSYRSPPQSSNASAFQLLERTHSAAVWGVPMSTPLKLQTKLLFLVSFLESSPSAAKRLF